MSELFSYLKQQTKSAHQALEATYPFSQMMQTASFSRSDYVAVLRILLAFHRHAQRWTQTMPASLREMLHSDAVIAALEKDLTQLTNNTDVPDFSLVVVAAPAADRAMAAGYVWMGSSLGGKLIERWLTANFPDLPHAYYSQMKTVSQQWPHFIRQASDNATFSTTQMAHIADSANALFTGLRETATHNQSCL